MGNDIVDMDVPGAKNKTARFTAKILALNETNYIRQSANPDVLLWAFWAAKETAYKVISKSHPDADFSPLRYHTAFSRSKGNLLPGIVETPHGRVTVNVFLFHTHIHCIGTNDIPDRLDNVRWGQQTIDSSTCESTAVRELAIDHIARYCGLNTENLEIRNDMHNYGTGPPILYVKGERASVDISLSHDGRFVGYAFVPRPTESDVVSCRL
ncbi:MAG: 4'-phosphopantetheinyl transferase family protein [Thermodesulfobacteriota bacterium]